MKLELDKINRSPKTLEEALEIIVQLLQIIMELKKENDELREQLNNNSSNSSLPPSDDRRKKKKTKLKSGRKRGGQQGHKAWQQSIVPVEEVNTIIDCKPAKRCDCGGVIQLKDKKQIHQVFEISLAKYEVTEYRIYHGCCEVCHLKHEGRLPAGVSWKGFGVRAQAMVSLLTSKYRLSKRLVQSWFKEVYQMPICLGSVSHVEHTVSQAIELIHTDVFAAVRNEKVVHVDETGHKECHKNGWAWIASVPNFTYFMLNPSRGKKVAKELIGDYQGRVIVSDRYSAYNYLPDENHQNLLGSFEARFSKDIRTYGKSRQNSYGIFLKIKRFPRQIIMQNAN